MEPFVGSLESLNAQKPPLGFGLSEPAIEFVAGFQAYVSVFALAVRESRVIPVWKDEECW